MSIHASNFSLLPLSADLVWLTEFPKAWNRPPEELAPHLPVPVGQIQIALAYCLNQGNRHGLGGPFGHWASRNGETKVTIPGKMFLSCPESCPVRCRPLPTNLFANLWTKDGHPKCLARFLDQVLLALLVSPPPSNDMRKVLFQSSDEKFAQETNYSGQLSPGVILADVQDQNPWSGLWNPRRGIMYVWTSPVDVVKKLWEDWLRAHSHIKHSEVTYKACTWPSTLQQHQNKMLG